VIARALGHSEVPLFWHVMGAWAQDVRKSQGPAGVVASVAHKVRMAHPTSTVRTNRPGWVARIASRERFAGCARSALLRDRDTQLESQSDGTPTAQGLGHSPPRP